MKNGLTLKKQWSGLKAIQETEQKELGLTGKRQERKGETVKSHGKAQAPGKDPEI